MKVGITKLFSMSEHKFENTKSVVRFLADVGASLINICHNAGMSSTPGFEGKEKSRYFSIPEAGIRGMVSTKIEGNLPTREMLISEYTSPGSSEPVLLLHKAGEETVLDFLQL